MGTLEPEQESESRTIGPRSSSDLSILIGSKYSIFTIDDYFETFVEDDEEEEGCWVTT
jgi:hypothetical protein